MSPIVRVYAGNYLIHFDKRGEQWVLLDRRTVKIVTGDDGLPKSFATEQDARDWADANSRAVRA